eukprot:scaffold997_cov250-Ochromonas_danica.AAC.8
MLLCPHRFCGSFISDCQHRQDVQPESIILQQARTKEKGESKIEARRSSQRQSTSVASREKTGERGKKRMNYDQVINLLSSQAVDIPPTPSNNAVHDISDDENGEELENTMHQKGQSYEREQRVVSQEGGIPSRAAPSHQLQQQLPSVSDLHALYATIVQGRAGKELMEEARKFHGTLFHECLALSRGDGYLSTFTSVEEEGEWMTSVYRQHLADLSGFSVALLWELLRYCVDFIVAMRNCVRQDYRNNLEDAKEWIKEFTELHQQLEGERKNDGSSMRETFGQNRQALARELMSLDDAYESLFRRIERVGFDLFRLVQTKLMSHLKRAVAQSGARDGYSGAGDKDEIKAWRKGVQSRVREKVVTVDALAIAFADDLRDAKKEMRKLFQSYEDGLGYAVEEVLENDVESDEDQESNYSPESDEDEDKYPQDEILEDSYRLEKRKRVHDQSLEAATKKRKPGTAKPIRPTVSLGRSITPAVRVAIGDRGILDISDEAQSKIVPSGRDNEEEREEKESEEVLWKVLARDSSTSPSLGPIRRRSAKKEVIELDYGIPLEDLVSRGEQEQEEAVVRLFHLSSHSSESQAIRNRGGKRKGKKAWQCRPQPRCYILASGCVAAQKLLNTGEEREKSSSATNIPVNLYGDHNLHIADQDHYQTWQEKEDEVTGGVLRQARRWDEEEEKPIAQNRDWEVFKLADQLLEKSIDLVQLPLTPPLLSSSTPLTTPMVPAGMSDRCMEIASKIWDHTSSHYSGAVSNISSHTFYLLTSAEDREAFLQAFLRDVYHTVRSSTVELIGQWQIISKMKTEQEERERLSREWLKKLSEMISMTNQLLFGDELFAFYRVQATHKTQNGGGVRKSIFQQHILSIAQRLEVQWTALLSSSFPSSSSYSCSSSKKLLGLLEYLHSHDRGLWQDAVTFWLTAYLKEKVSFLHKVIAPEDGAGEEQHEREETIKIAWKTLQDVFRGLLLLLLRPQSSDLLQGIAACFIYREQDGDTACSMGASPSFGQGLRSRYGNIASLVTHSIRCYEKSLVRIVGNGGGGGTQSGKFWDRMWFHVISSLLARHSHWAANGSSAQDGYCNPLCTVLLEKERGEGAVYSTESLWLLLLHLQHAVASSSSKKRLPQGWALARHLCDHHTRSLCLTHSLSLEQVKCAWALVVRTCRRLARLALLWENPFEGPALMIKVVKQSAGLLRYLPSFNHASSSTERGVVNREERKVMLLLSHSLHLPSHDEEEEEESGRRHLLHQRLLLLVSMLLNQLQLVNPYSPYLSALLGQRQSPPSVEEPQEGEAFSLQAIDSIRQSYREALLHCLISTSSSSNGPVATTVMPAGSALDSQWARVARRKLAPALWQSLDVVLFPMLSSSSPSIKNGRSESSGQAEISPVCYSTALLLLLLVKEISAIFPDEVRGGATAIQEKVMDLIIMAEYQPPLMPTSLLPSSSHATKDGEVSGLVFLAAFVIFNPYPLSTPFSTAASQRSSEDTAGLDVLWASQEKDFQSLLPCRSLFRLTLAIFEQHANTSASELVIASLCTSSLAGQAIVSYLASHQAAVLDSHSSRTFETGEGGLLTGLHLDLFPFAFLADYLHLLHALFNLAATTSSGINGSAPPPPASASVGGKKGVMVKEISSVAIYSLHVLLRFVLTYITQTFLPLQMRFHSNNSNSSHSSALRNKVEDYLTKQRTGLQDVANILLSFLPSLRTVLPYYLRAMDDSSEAFTLLVHSLSPTSKSGEKKEKSKTLFPGLPQDSSRWASLAASRHHMHSRGVAQALGCAVQIYADIAVMLCSLSPANAQALPSSTGTTAEEVVGTFVDITSRHLDQKMDNYLGLFLQAVLCHRLFSRYLSLPEDEHEGSKNAALLSFDRLIASRGISVEEIWLMVVLSGLLLRPSKGTTAVPWLKDFIITTHRVAQRYMRRNPRHPQRRDTQEEIRSLLLTTYKHYFDHFLASNNADTIGNENDGVAFMEVLFRTMQLQCNALGVVAGHSLWLYKESSRWGTRTVQLLFRSLRHLMLCIFRQRGGSLTEIRHANYHNLLGLVQGFARCYSSMHCRASPLTAWWSLDDVLVYFQEFFQPVAKSLISAFASRYVTVSSFVEDDLSMTYRQLTTSLVHFLVPLVPYATRCPDWEVLLFVLFLRHPTVEQYQRSLLIFWAVVLTLRPAHLPLLVVVEADGKTSLNSRLKEEFELLVLTEYLLKEESDLFLQAIDNVVSLLQRTNSHQQIVERAAAAAIAEQNGIIHNYDHGTSDTISVRLDQFRDYLFSPGCLNWQRAYDGLLSQLQTTIAGPGKETGKSKSQEIMRLVSTLTVQEVQAKVQSYSSMLADILTGIVS